jgi:hypothetical protein
MREYILTDREKAIIEKYLTTGEKLEGYRVLRHLCQRIQQTKIQEELKLIEKFLNKK